jgi:MFS family permease
MTEPNKKLLWTGRVLSGLAAAVFVMSAVMKFKGGPELDEGMKHLDLPASMVTPLAVVELACVAVYLIPATAVLGAVLLAGYLGGAICTHWRVGDPFVTQIAIGVVLWLGLWLREPRLRALLPLRRA